MEYAITIDGFLRCRKKGESSFRAATQDEVGAFTKKNPEYAHVAVEPAPEPEPAPDEA